MNPQTFVVKYDPQWPKIYEQIKNQIWPELENIALAIEHVGSTSIVGLAAKPVIDIDIVVETTDSVLDAIETLKRLGYSPLGTKGVPGREAFRRPKNSPKHNLYVCLKSSVAFKNHILFREALREKPVLKEQYAQLKIKLAEQYAENIDGYCEAKTSFILEILKEKGLNESELAEVAGANSLV